MNINDKSPREPNIFYTTPTQQHLPAHNNETTAHWLTKLGKQIIDSPNSPPNPPLEQQSSPQTSPQTEAVAVAKPSPMHAITSPTGEVTRENLAEHMQYIASNYYAQPFTHYDTLLVEHEGQEVLWKDLSPQHKFDVVYAHSLPHNRPKLMQREKFPSEAAWVAHIEHRLLSGSHKPDGTPAGRENDPREIHGTDHGMRVGIFSAVYAYLYNKYDPDAHITPEEVVAIQLAGGFHDSGRQTEGVDVDDKKSAAIATDNLTKWGFSPAYIDASKQAILEKDGQKLSSKHVIAKCVQCADATEYGRVGPFNPKFLDIFKEFNGYQATPQVSWFENIPPKPLKEGKTLDEFNLELKAVNQEMSMLITSSIERRVLFSQPGKNYYTEILQLINPTHHPKLYAMFVEMNIL